MFFKKKKALLSVLCSLAINTSFQSSAYFYDDNVETSTKQKSGMSNGLNSYIHSVQIDMLNAGKDLVEEHEADSKQFIEDYNAYTDNIVEKTSKPISLSGDSDCLANLRIIDLDIIPVDPMDLLKPLKLKLKDLIENSPCEMVTDAMNEQIDKIDFSADSPFRSIGVRSNFEDKQANDEIERLAKLQRKARIRNMVFDMGSDFKLKLTERRNVVFNEDGAVITSDDEYEVKKTTSIPKAESLLNSEDLLNIEEVFGSFLNSDDGNNQLESNSPGGNGNANSQSSLDDDRNAADEAARAAAKNRGDY
jgi:hypothetical protein